MVSLLLVEDNMVDIDLFKEYIEEYNQDYRISTINRLKQAIDFLERNPQIDIIILDLNLPDSNGIQTFERVLQVRGDTPIIVLTGMNDQELANKTISQGAGDYLVKNKLNPYVIHKSILHTIEREKSRKLMQVRERQILQNQKMEAIGRLAGGIAHDFNNLITIISGYSNILLQRANDSEMGTSFELPLKEIIKASNGGAQLIEQLMLFSREKEIDKQVVDLGGIIENIQSMLRRIIPVHIELNISSDPRDHYVRFNQTQLEQIIINLVVNAVDAINDSNHNMQGMISISLRKVTTESIDINELDANENKSYIQLVISDNGTGMDSNTKEQIFDPFYTTKNEGEGTGLGLSTVYGLISSIKGQITIDTEVGVGTTFNIYIPECDQSQDKKDYDQLESDRTEVYNTSLTDDERNLNTIMVVEDNQSLRLLIVNILNDLGYRVIMFEHGLDAITYLTTKDECNIDLIISDILMPKLDGRDFYHQLRDDLGIDIPFLFISGYREEEVTTLQFVQENDLNLLKKPFTSQELQNSVDTLLFEYS